MRNSGYVTGLLFLLDWEYQWLGFATRGPQCMLVLSLISKSDVVLLSESRPGSDASQQMQVGASPFSLSLQWIKQQSTTYCGIFPMLHVSFLVGCVRLFPRMIYDGLWCESEPEDCGLLVLAANTASKILPVVLIRLMGRWLFELIVVCLPDPYGCGLWWKRRWFHKPPHSLSTYCEGYELGQQNGP